MPFETGCSFRECLENYVFGPLNLADTAVVEKLADWNECVPGYARDFTDGELTDIRAVYHPGWCAPGVAVSTAADVTAFFNALFRGAYLTLPDRADLTDLVAVPGKHPPAVRPSYGLGVMADPEGLFGPSYGHGGEGPGYSVSATVLPEFHKGCLSIAVLRNGSHGPSGGATLQKLLPSIAAALE